MGTNAVQFITGKALEHFELHTGAGNTLRVIPAGYPETYRSYAVYTLFQQD